MHGFYPEGRLCMSEEHAAVLRSPELMEKAFKEQTILEAQAVMCDASHDLIVDIPNARGVIPRKEGALGIAEGTTRDIALLSRVNKPVCFVIDEISEQNGMPLYILSRAKAQRRCMDQYISKLSCGDVIPARVTHMEPFGAFVDIGCGIPSLIPIDAISVSRISHPNDRFYNGQNIYAVVKSIDGERISLTHRELLGTWEQNSLRFEVGSTVPAIVRSVESYGIFIEVAPNLAGLAEPREGILPGQCVSVNIKALKPDRMKLKLAIVDVLHGRSPSISFDYFIKEGHIDKWIYSPKNCTKSVITDFTNC